MVLFRGLNDVIGGQKDEVKASLIHFIIAIQRASKRCCTYFLRCIPVRPRGEPILCKN